MYIPIFKEGSVDFKMFKTFLNQIIIIVNLWNLTKCILPALF